MIGTKELLEAVVGELNNNISSIGVTGVWQHPAPDEAEYPFLTISLVISQPTPTFREDHNEIVLDIHCWVNDPSPAYGVTVHDRIETLLHRKILAMDNPYTMFCAVATGYNVIYQNEDHIWDVVGTYRFKIQRPAT